MKHSFFTQMGSYFIDIPIEEKISKYSGKLELILRKGRYLLCTTNAVYSFDDLYTNFRDSFKQIEFDKYNIKNVLVLGLGLGSIPFLLEKVFKKQYNYTLVEIDPEVIDLAHKYTLNRLVSPLNVICSDAIDFVNSCTQTFDLIAIDIFIDNLIPSEFESILFLENIQKLLNSNALLMYNRLSYNDDLEAKTLDFFESKFVKVFEDGHCLSCSGNKMLLNMFL
ncbi:MAG: hypothetical protein MK207_08760 [Saprospiraceae bacterium]|nr:hypothetical protein [Saprospiraceae bacterium]